MAQCERAVVIGGSVAGLAAAAVLADRAREVMIVERQASSPEPAAPVSLAPQGEFPHVLLGGGAAALERILPGFAADLYAHGAVGEGLEERRCHWWAAGAVRRMVPELGVEIPMCSRALVEGRLRAAVLARANVVQSNGHVVRGLRVEGGRVVGVDTTVDDRPDALDADLVVDASGRGSRAPAWLEALGAGRPPVSEVQIGVTYTAVDVERRPSDLGGALFTIVQNSPALARIGVALPAEGDRWKIVLGGYFGDAAEPTPEGMRAFARSLPDSAVADLLENAWCREPARYRFPSSRRHHYEKVRRLPGGFVVLGDAVASFNPIYGQGMTSAVQQAEELGRCLDRVGNTDRLPRTVARAVAQVVANPWRVAAGADFIYPQTTGPKAPMTDRINRYLEKVMVAAAHDEVVDLALTRVQHLLAAPPTLMAPGMVRRVRRVVRSIGGPSRRGAPAAVPSAA